MKKVVLFIVALVMILALTACGAAGTGSTETTSTADATVTATAPAVLEVPRAFVPSGNTPQFFIDARKENQAILLMFYSPDQISQEVMRGINDLFENEKYVGLVKFLLLDIDDGEEITELARDFSVGYIPFTAILDEDGTVVLEKSGYVDVKVLEQALHSAVYR